jgi:putative intracellular protease/amidase
MSANKEVLLVLTDMWADWEAAYAVALINETPGFSVKTVALDLLPKASIGGLRTEIDRRIEDCADFTDTALVILPGGYSWKDNQYPEIADFVRRALASQVPVAAICGATVFLGKHGILDNILHTGDELELFQNEKGYNGRENYRPVQVIADRGLITANETAAVDFARAIFDTLKIAGDEEIALWYNAFKNGMFQE